MTAPDANPQFPHPKILAIDVNAQTTQALATAGYNVRGGTFGTPFKVERSATFEALENVSQLPGHREQDIVIVDLATELGENARDDVRVPYGEKGIFAKRNEGVVDPRPVGMRGARNAFDRVYDHGGIFIVLAAPRLSNQLVYAQQTRSGIYTEETLDWDTWSFLTRLGAVSTVPDRGTDLREATAGGATFLTPYLVDAEFFCTLRVDYTASDQWIVLATNKFEEPVAAAIAPRADNKEGWIFLLPQVRDQTGLVKALLDSVLPGLSPELFPHFEGDNWTRRPEYASTSVVPLEQAIKQAQEEARAKVAELEHEIEEARKREGFMHDLLTRHDDALVAAVKAALERLGFTDVRDVDEDESAGPRREDIQVHDASPTLLVEVKGLGGLPKESEAMQVVKYVLPRIREWNRTDVQGLAIINHQRHLPALSREHVQVFQQDVLTNAEHEFGLLTTWDLFRLVRNAERLNWPKDAVRALFYDKGRILPIPGTHTAVGEVAHFWEQAHAMAVRLDAELRIGDTIAIEGHVDVQEQQVDSLRIEDGDVVEANAGDVVGIATALSKRDVRVGARVYRRVLDAG